MKSRQNSTIFSSFSYIVFRDRPRHYWWNESDFKL